MSTTRFILGGLVALTAGFAGSKLQIKNNETTWEGTISRLVTDKKSDGDYTGTNVAYLDSYLDDPNGPTYHKSYTLALPNNKAIIDEADRCLKTKTPVVMKYDQTLLPSIFTGTNKQVTEIIAEDKTESKNYFR